jgi:hypothetical protein
MAVTPLTKNMTMVLQPPSLIIPKQLDQITKQPSPRRVRPQGSPAEFGADPPQAGPPAVRASVLSTTISQPENTFKDRQVRAIAMSRSTSLHGSTSQPMCCVGSSSSRLPHNRLQAVPSRSLESSSLCPSVSVGCRRLGAAGRKTLYRHACVDAAAAASRSTAPTGQPLALQGKAVAPRSSRPSPSGSHVAGAQRRRLFGVSCAGWQALLITYECMPLVALLAAGLPCSHSFLHWITPRSISSCC